MGQLIAENSQDLNIIFTYFNPVLFKLQRIVVN